MECLLAYCLFYFYCLIVCLQNLAGFLFKMGIKANIVADVAYSVWVSNGRKRKEGRKKRNNPIKQERWHTSTLARLFLLCCTRGSQFWFSIAYGSIIAGQIEIDYGINPFKVAVWSLALINMVHIIVGIHVIVINISSQRCWVHFSCVVAAALLDPWKKYLPATIIWSRFILSHSRFILSHKFPTPLFQAFWIQIFSKHWC